IPQAAGVGYALRCSPDRRARSIAACSFGEGAASDGVHFPAGLLLASTIPSSTLLVACNEFAISTPRTDWFFGAVLTRSVSPSSHYYSCTRPQLRVDGNDILTAIAAVREARRRPLKQVSSVCRLVIPIFIPRRVGHHSTSDDSFAYRQRSEIQDRIARLRRYLESQGLSNAMAEEELRTRLKDGYDSVDVMQAFKHAELLTRCELGELFTDVYGGKEPISYTRKEPSWTGLLKKCGNSWEPWRSELARFKNRAR
ncbi:thiamine diphosphate-binding protein, partial [Mycena rebaudengoi]